MTGSVDGNLLIEDIRGKGFLVTNLKFLLKTRPRTYTSKMEDEELHQISRVTRFKGQGISLSRL